MVGINMKHSKKPTFRSASVGISIIFGILLLAANTVQAQDSLLFEAYYRVMKSGNHVGYYIMKHEFDAKKKQFLATTFLKLEGGDDITESIKATASEDFKPLAFTYTAIGSGQTRTVDAKVVKGKITASINANGKPEKVSSQLKKDTISSLFLVYAILRSPQGLKAKTKFTYEAVAEELAQETSGVVDLKDFEDVSGNRALRLENEFLGTKSSNFVNEKGEILMTLSPTQKISVEMVATPEAALGSFKPPIGLLKTLFGGMPEGKKNSFAQNGMKIPATTTPANTKGKEGP